MAGAEHHPVSSDAYYWLIMQQQEPARKAAFFLWFAQYLQLWKLYIVLFKREILKETPDFNADLVLKYEVEAELQ